MCIFFWYIDTVPNSNPIWGLLYYDQGSRTWMNNYTPQYIVAPLTHWGRVTHICVGKLTVIGSDNGLSPGRRQAIIWTNARILLIRTLGTNFSQILIEILILSFKKMHLKVSSAKRWPFCLGLNVLITNLIDMLGEEWYLLYGHAIISHDVMWDVITCPSNNCFLHTIPLVWCFKTLHFLPRYSLVTP